MAIEESITFEDADRELLYEVLYALREGTDAERNIAFHLKIPKISDKRAARDELIRLLTESEKSDIRGWAATSLAKLCGTGDDTALDAVRRQVQQETDLTARSWMLLTLFRMAGDAVAPIEVVVRGFAHDTRSENARSRALALAMLCSKGDREAANQLKGMLLSEDPDVQWYASRALDKISCREMVEPLVRVILNPLTWADARNCCVRSLGYVESATAALALGRVLTELRDPIIQETAIEGLERLGKSRRLHQLLDKLSAVGETKYSVADSLMAALLDSNAQIRHRAAEALPLVMPELVYANADQEAQKRAMVQARTAALQRVAKKLLSETISLDREVPLLVDALRVIDPPDAQSAVTVLRDYLSSDDLSERQRAEYALTLVGGEKAVETLLAQKSEVLRAYNELLSKADTPIQELFEKTMEQAQLSFRISQYMSVTVFILGVVGIAAGMWMAFTAGQDGIQRIFGAGTSVLAVVAVLLDMTFRDPHQRVQEATSVLLRTKVIFLGYVRQIHQVDATFKHEFIEGGREFGVDQVQETVKEISAIMNNTMALIDKHLTIARTGKSAVEQFNSFQDTVAKTLKVRHGPDGTAGTNIGTGQDNKETPPSESSGTLAEGNIGTT